MAEKPLKKVLDEIHENDCPICRAMPVSINVDGPDKITLSPCGHSFSVAELIYRFGIASEF